MDGGLIKGRKTSLIAVTVSCIADVMFSPQDVLQAQYRKQQVSPELCLL